MDKQIAKILEKLYFVQWDRYTENSYYGWIDREDNYKDFVIVIFENGDIDDVGYITSSKKYDEEIKRLLGLEGCEHMPCKRIENRFDIKNCIHLKK